MLLIGPPVLPVTRYPEPRPTPPIPGISTIYDTQYLYVDAAGSWFHWKRNTAYKSTGYAWFLLGPWDAVEGREVSVDGVTFRFGRVGGFKTPVLGWYVSPEDQERINSEVESLSGSPEEPIYAPMPTDPRFIWGGAAQHVQLDYGTGLGTVDENYFRQYIFAAYRMAAQDRMAALTDSTTFFDPINETSYATDPNFDLLEWPDAKVLSDIEKIFGVAGYNRFWVLFVDPSDDTIVLLNVPHVHDGGWKASVKRFGRDEWTWKIGMIAVNFIPIVGQVITLAIKASGYDRAAVQRGKIEEFRDSDVRQMAETAAEILAKEAQISFQVQAQTEQAERDEILSVIRGGGNTAGVPTIFLVGGIVLGVVVLMLGLVILKRR